MANSSFYLLGPYGYRLLALALLRYDEEYVEYESLLFWPGELMKLKKLFSFACIGSLRDSRWAEQFILFSQMLAFFLT